MPSKTYTDNTGSIDSDWLNPVDQWTYGPATKTIAKTLTPEDGVKIYPQGSDGGVFIGVTGLAPGTLTDNGGAFYGTEFIPTGGDGSAGWRRDYDGEYNSKWFGVAGDGTNIYTQLQNVITLSETNNIPLYIPENNLSSFYNIGANTLSITKPIVIRTAGSRYTTISATGLGVGSFVIDIDGTAFGTYENADIGGLTIIGNGADCIQIKDASNSRFYDIGIRSCRHGIIYTGTRCFSNTFEKVVPITGVTGNTVLIKTHTGGGHHTFSDCTFGGDRGLYIDSDVLIDSVVINSSNFEQCTTNSMFVRGIVKGLSVFGGRTEGCNGVDFLIDPIAAKYVWGLNIIGVAFSASDSGGSDRIQFGGSGGAIKGFVVDGCNVDHGTSSFSANLVDLSSNGESGQITNNFLNGLKASCAPANAIRTGVAIYNNEANDGVFDPRFTLHEGTFTFTDNSGATLTFATNSGVYTRIGRVVTWSSVITFPVTADVNTVALSGLPFDILFGTSAVGRAGLNVDDTTSATVLYGFHGPTAVDEISLRVASSVAATNANCSNETFYLSGTYTTSEN